MGYVSYLEDIIERFNSNLSSIREATAPPGSARKTGMTLQQAELERNIRLNKTVKQQKVELDRLLLNCEGLLNELMELATNPEILLADEVRRLTDENTNLKDTIKRGRSVIKELRDGYNKAGKALDEKNKLIKSLKEELAILQDPASFYDSSFKGK